MCLLQGDVGLHNMLVVDDRLTALVDWEAATIGPPARELAAVWPTATALMPWDDFVYAYREAGGPAEAVEPRAVDVLPPLLRARRVHDQSHRWPSVPYRGQA